MLHWVSVYVTHCRLNWSKPGTKSGTHKTLPHQDNPFRRQTGNTSFSDTLLFLIPRTDLTNHILLYLALYSKFLAFFLLQPDKHLLIYSKWIYRRDWLTNLKSFRDIWKCDKGLNHRTNIGRRRTTKYSIKKTKQNRNSESHFEAATMLFRGLIHCWSTGLVVLDLMALKSPC